MYRIRVSSMILLLTSYLTMPHSANEALNCTFHDCEILYCTVSTVQSFFFHWRQINFCAISFIFSKPSYYSTFSLPPLRLLSPSISSCNFYRTVLYNIFMSISPLPPKTLWSKTDRATVQYFDGLFLSYSKCSMRKYAGRSYLVNRIWGGGVKREVLSGNKVSRCML